MTDHGGHSKIGLVSITKCLLLGDSNRISEKIIGIETELVLIIKINQVKILEVCKHNDNQVRSWLTEGILIWLPIV